MIKFFQNKKGIVILSIVLAVVLAIGVGIFVWQQTGNTNSEDSSGSADSTDSGNGTDPTNADMHTIRFVTNGGNEVETLSVESGTLLSQSDLPVPSKRGEMFLSWYTDEALTVPYWEATIDSDLTLYASYTKPIEDETVSELTESIIPFADVDFSVTVCASTELTSENIGQYVALTVNYGQHATGEPIRLSVTSEGGGIYRIGGNYAAGGDYTLLLISDAVTFNPADEMLVAYGLTDALRTLRFRVLGESYMNGNISGKVTDIPMDAIVVKSSDSITILGADRHLIGATEADNAVICVGDSDNLADYRKIVALESASGSGNTYRVRPATVDEVYDHITGYQWENLDGGDLVVDEEVRDQVVESMSNNEQLNNYITYLATAATYTPTYETLSMQKFGEVVVTPLTTVVTPSGAKVGVEFDAYNGNFNKILDEDQRDGFVKLTLGFEYQVKLAKVGSKGSITAQIDMQIDLWVWIGVGGYFEVGWGEYEIDCGMTTLTQTEINFAISLMTDSSKKAVNIDDEIEAIYNSAKEPTPENLLEQYNELMSGSSKPIEICDQDIFELPVLSFLYGAVEISIPVKFVVSLDMQATFSSYFTVLSGCDVGLAGDEDSGLDLVYNRMSERFKYRLELRGHIELRAGLEVDLKLSLAYGLASVSLGVQAGFYGEIYGYFFYEVDRLNGITATNSGGAYYFELGAYVDIRLRAEVCKIKYSGSLWDKKYPFYSAGEKEILYGFVNPVGDVIELDKYNGSVYIEDTGILDVYIYDITKPRSDKNPKKVEDYPFRFSRYDLSFSNGSFANKWNGEIYFQDSFFNGEAFEAIMTINYKGTQLSFRDTLTKYVTVRMALSEDVDWDKLDEKYKVNFTIDGEVIFTREYGYGSTICFEPSDHNSYYLNKHLEHLMYNGKLISNLRESEREALYNAGYAEARWYIMKGETGDRDADIIFVTEDMTIEATSNVKRRPWKVTLGEGDNVTTYEVNHGETLKMPSPREGAFTTPAYIYNFVGWKAENGDIYSAGKEYAITSDLSLKTHYYPTERKYSVTFDANGGTIGNGGETFTMQVFAGEIPEHPITPERERTDTARYEFVGWSPVITKAWKDVTYTAQWREIKLYTVTFNAGEGQFDESGERTITITVDEGHVLSDADIPTDPYRKAEGGYYAFDAWNAPVSAGTVINGHATYTAGYRDELTVTSGVLISDGVHTEDIVSFLDGSNQISGYTYTLNTEYYGNTLEITEPGLTISGNAADIHITVTDTEVTLHELTLSQSTRTDIINARGRSTLRISGTVRLTSGMDGEAIRGDYSEASTADIVLCGTDTNSKLIVDAQAYGIAVYGALTIEQLDVEIHMPEELYVDSSTGLAYSGVALQVHNHPEGILTVTNADIVVNSGVVNVAWLYMTNSHLIFTAEEFMPGYSSGLDIMNYYQLVETEALIVLTNSHISFARDIVISISVSLTDDTYYYVNTDIESVGFLSTYPSLDAFIADVDRHAYSGILAMDSSSSIT